MPAQPPRPAATPQAPRSQPTPHAPAQPAPRAQPNPRSIPVAPTQPGTSRSQPTPRSQPAPRTTTRGDLRTREVPTAPPPIVEQPAAPAPVSGQPRNAPGAVGGSVRGYGSRTNPGEVTTREVPAQPTARELYERRGRSSGGNRAATEPIDPRYRPTRSIEPRRSVVAPQPRDVTPRASGPSVSGRYAGRPSARTGAPAPTNLRSGVVRTTPSTGAPRLVSGVVGTRNSPGPTSHRGDPHRVAGRGRLGGCYDPWHSYWDPWHHSSGLWSLRWHWPHCGFSTWGFGWSLWYPWYYWHCAYWDWTYGDCWWNSWSSPYCASTGYWWYPSSTYCPTYLYVPSSTVVVVEREPEAAPEPAPAREVVVAGGPVRGGVAIRDLPSFELARKYVELGDFYFQAGRYGEAADAYARARTYAPDDASVHFVLADAAFAQGDYHFAAFLIGEALRLDPSLATAETDKRLFYGDLAEFEAQMRSLDDYLAKKPYDVLAHLVRGYNLRFSGQPGRAVEAFRKVLELEPDNRTAATFLAALAPAEPLAR
ncbi:MAG: tetratricopeptide repeat protein [Planctomycetes bacterium]|nr:tetratricopeptide repeat protein [Planctomycetota bacterium]